jgi:hypothetical protein
MIEKIIQTSRMTEVDASTSLILSAYKSSGLADDSHLSGIMESIQELSGPLNNAINRIKSESELEEKDELRDNAIRSFYYQVQGYMYHTDSTIKAAAEKVMSVFNHYGLKTISDSYATQSSLVNSMITDLSTTEMTDNIALLSGVAESLANIQTAQEAFEASDLIFEQEKAKETSVESATTIKKQIVPIINNKLVVYLRAMVAVDEENYSEFGEVINQIISNNNITVKKRSNSSDEDDEDDAAE